VTKSEKQPGNYGFEKPVKDKRHGAKRSSESSLTWRGEKATRRGRNRT
jgi:hypothetical protein